MSWGAVTDTTPVFSNVTDEVVSETQVRISWNVLPGAQGEVRWGLVTGGPYDNATTRETDYLPFHSQVLNNPPQDSTVYYVVWGRGADGVEAVSDEGSFSVAAPVTDLPPLDDLDFVATGTLTVPGLLEVVAEPTFGTEVTRVNLVAGQGHRYSCPMPWNSDESLLYLDYPPGGSGSQRPLLDGQTLEVLVTNTGPFANFRWHPTDPNVGFGYANPNQMRRYSVTSAGFTLTNTYTLSQYSVFNYTGGQGRPDNSGRYHPFVFKKSNNDWGLGIWDAVSLTVEERVCGNSSAAIGTLIDCSYMSWDGNYTVGMFETDGAGNLQGTWAWQRGNLSGAGVKLSQNNSHADVGELPDGTQVMVMASQAANGSGNGQPVSGGYIGYYRLDTGAWTPLITSYPNAHVSTANIQVPDYAVISSFSTSGSQPGINEVFALRLSTGQVRRFAHSHKGTSDTSYAAQPQASASPSMTRVIWRSNWDNGAIGCFVAGEDVIRPAPQ